MSLVIGVLRKNIFRLKIAGSVKNLMEIVGGDRLQSIQSNYLFILLADSWRDRNHESVGVYAKH